MSRAIARPTASVQALGFQLEFSTDRVGDVFLKVDADQARIDVDLDVIRAWWSLRSLRAVRWLVEHGFDPFAPGCEVDVLRSRM